MRTVRAWGIVSADGKQLRTFHGSAVPIAFDTKSEAGTHRNSQRERLVRVEIRELKKRKAAK